MLYPKSIKRIAFFLIVLLISLLSSSCEETSVGGGGLEGRESLSDPAVHPRVINTVPPKNGVGPYNLFNPADGWFKPHFVVHFNKFMDPYSVSERSVVCEGFDRPVRVILHREYQYGFGKSALYTDILEFDIIDSVYYGPKMIYDVGRSYTIVIDSTLQDINGNRLSQKHSFTFTPEPNFRVLAVYPRDGQTLLSLSYYTYLGVSFNRPVGQNILSFVQLSPQPAGRWIINQYDSLGIYFAPTSGLSFNTNYTITMNQGGQDKKGNPLQQQTVSRFATPPFQVMTASPPNGTSYVNLFSSVSASFTGIIDTGTVRSSVTILPTIAGYFSAYESGFYFQALNGLRSTTTYSVSISTGVKAKDGTPLSAPYSFSFTTQPFLVTYTSPSDGQNNISRSSSIQIGFNAPVDGPTGQSAFSISPSIAGSLNSYTGSNSIYFYPSSQMSAQTTYTVTISTAMKSAGGDSLYSAYSFSFVTGS